ncbi:MAG: hypothetical protein ACOYPS_04520, partial [Phycisphaerales bacterium]
MITDSATSPPSATPAVPSTSRRRDPGTPRSALVAWIATVVLVGTVVFLNQFAKPAPKPQVDPSAAEIKAPGLLNSTAVISKMMVKLVHVLKTMEGGKYAGQLDGASLISRIDEQATSPVDRLRVAMAAGELGGREEALQRLKSLEQEQDIPAKVVADVATVRQVLEAERPAELPADLREGLIARHGWFAKLALSRGLDDASAERAPLVEGGLRVGTIFASLALILLTVVLAGLGSLVTLVILLATGRIRRRFVPPLPGGSAFLEVLPVFAGGFLLI